MEITAVDLRPESYGSKLAMAKVDMMTEVDSMIEVDSMTKVYMNNIEIRVNSKAT